MVCVSVEFALWNLLYFHFELLNLYNLCHLSKARVVQFDELEGGQQLPCANPPHVNVEETEAGLLVVLLHRFKLWLSKSPAHRHRTALQTHPHTGCYVMTPSNRVSRMYRFKAECDCHHVLITVEIDDDQRWILLELLCHSLQ